MKFADVLLVLGINTAFTLLATVGPGLKICYQQITDLIAKRQRRFSVAGQIVRELLAKSR
ncbi:MAG: hypothetical protein FH749_15190 [Firmicutes bacterium]|nr:hypothetical protein [Bacillota bacterium]